PCRWWPSNWKSCAAAPTSVSESGYERVSGIEGRPLRVALVTSSYSFIADGVALTLNRLVGWLQAQGVQVKVFAPTAARAALAHEGELISVPSVPLPGRPEYRLALGMAATVKRQLLDFQPDLIHIAVPDLL